MTSPYFSGPVQRLHESSDGFERELGSLVGQACNANDVSFPHVVIVGDEHQLTKYAEVDQSREPAVLYVNRDAFYKNGHVRIGLLGLKSIIHHEMKHRSPVSRNSITRRQRELTADVGSYLHGGWSAFEGGLKAAFVRGGSGLHRRRAAIGLTPRSGRHVLHRAESVDVHPTPQERLVHGFANASRIAVPDGLNRSTYRLPSQITLELAARVGVHTFEHHDAATRFVVSLTSGNDVPPFQTVAEFAGRVVEAVLYANGEDPQHPREIAADVAVVRSHQAAWAADGLLKSLLTKDALLNVDEVRRGTFEYLRDAIGPKLPDFLQPVPFDEFDGVVFDLFEPSTPLDQTL